MVQLASFRYIIKYRPGMQNKNTDALSSLPEQKQEMDPVHTDWVVAEEDGAWAEHQSKDPNLAQTRQ